MVKSEEKKPAKLPSVQQVKNDLYRIHKDNTPPNSHPSCPVSLAWE